MRFWRKLFGSQANTTGSKPGMSAPKAEIGKGDRARHASYKDTEEAAALRTAIESRDRARITDTNIIKSYSFNTIGALHLAYAFARARYLYPGLIGLYKSHKAANYAFFLVFLRPTVDGWGNDEQISSIIGDMPDFLHIGDFETATKKQLSAQTDELPFPTDNEMLLLSEELKRRARGK